MEFLQAIMPGLLIMCISIAISLIGSYIWLYFFMKDIDKQYRKYDMTPPERDWLFRRK